MSMRTTSVLYSSDLRLKEVRGVNLEKMLSLKICASDMHFIHGQSSRVTAALLDSAFCFVENDDGKIDAYCLSYEEEEEASAASCAPSASSCSTPSSVNASNRIHQLKTLSGASDEALSASSTAEHSNKVKKHKLPSTKQLKDRGFVRKVCNPSAAFNAFLSSPRLMAVPEDEGHAGGALDEASKKRELVIPVHCTIACYKPSMRSNHMGKMLLSSACNFPAQRFGVPAHAKDLSSLLQHYMKELRIYNIYVQHNSLLVLEMQKKQHQLFTSVCVQHATNEKEQQDRRSKNLYACKEWNLSIKL